MKSNLKQNVKYGLIGLFILFTLNRCTVACNRAIEIDNLTIQAKHQGFKLDSVIKQNELLVQKVDLLSVMLHDKDRADSIQQSMSRNADIKMQQLHNIYKEQLKTIQSLNDRIQKKDKNNK